MCCDLQISVSVDRHRLRVAVIMEAGAVVMVI